MIRPEKPDLNSRELACMEDEEYFEEEGNEYINESNILSYKHTNNNNKQPNGEHSVEKEGKQFLLDDAYSSSESDTNSEVDYKLAKDHIANIKNHIHKKQHENEEEEGEKAFHKHTVSRSPSVESLSNKIDIQLKFKSLSEDNVSQNGADDINVKRLGSDLESDEDMRDDSKIDPQKRLKL